MEDLTLLLCLLSIGSLLLSVLLKKRSVVVSMFGLLITILGITKAVQDSSLGDDMSFVIFPLFFALLIHLAMIAWPNRAGW